MLELFYQHGIRGSSAERCEIDAASSNPGATPGCSTSAAPDVGGEDHDSHKHGENRKQFQVCNKGFEIAVTILEWVIEWQLNEYWS